MSAIARDGGLRPTRLPSALAAAFSGLLAALAGLLIADAASAADLFRAHRHRVARHIGREGLFPGDEACPRDEPAVYKPRIGNFREPLCDAARPYGLSQHLYDVSADILIDRGN